MQARSPQHLEAGAAALNTMEDGCSMSSAPAEGWRELASWPGTFLCQAMVPERAAAGLSVSLDRQHLPPSPAPSSLTTHLHAAVDCGDRCDTVMLVGAQQATEATDELLVPLTEEAERVPVVFTDPGLWVPREL